MCHNRITCTQVSSKNTSIKVCSTKRDSTHLARVKHNIRGQKPLSSPLNQIIRFNFHFNTLETLKQDYTTPLGRRFGTRSKSLELGKHGKAYKGQFSSLQDSSLWIKSFLPWKCVMCQRTTPPSPPNPLKHDVKPPKVIFSSPRKFAWVLGDR